MMCLKMMLNTNKIKTIGFEHNLMQVVFGIGGSRFPFTFRLYEDEFTQQLSFMTRMNAVWYRYVIVLSVNGTTSSIKANNIIAVAENPNGTEVRKDDRAQISPVTERICNLN